MNRINQLFDQKKENILSIYFCAGTPSLEGTATVIRTLEQKGIDMIEIGIPFSDPMADGPVIQAATTHALRNGMTLRRLFAQLDGIRPAVQIPLILMAISTPSCNTASKTSAVTANGLESTELSSPTFLSVNMKRNTEPPPSATE